MSRITLLVCIFISTLLPHSVGANVPIINDPQRPYDPLPVDAAIEKEQLYLGELVGDPHLFEVTLAEEKEFSMTVLQLDGATTTSFSFIIVRDNGNNRGVSEVGRVNGKEVAWQGYRDPVFAMRFKQGLSFSETLSPGVYRFEVSAPDNFGKYLMILGTESGDSGYFDELAQIRSVQQFFDQSSFRMLLSSYVLYPIGIITLFVFMIYTWQRTRRRTSIETGPHA